MDSASHEAWWILLVDNDEEDYLLTRTMLHQVEGRKIHLDWASSFAQAWELLSANQYTAVLVDYDLGGYTGIDLIRQVTARRYPAPLILYTGRVSYEVDMEAMQAGATLYLTKLEVSPLLFERFIRYAVERRRIEEELDRRLQERSDILESIKDGFFAIDRAWRITYINKRAARNNGLEPEDLQGKIIWEVFPTLLGSSIESAYRQVMEGGAPMNIESQGVVNLSAWYNISIYPSAEGISIYWQNISERKRADEALKQSEATYRAIARNFPDGAIFIVDRSLRYLVADGAALSQLGMQRDNLEGRLVEEALQEPERSAVLNRFRTTLGGKSHRFEAYYHERALWTQYVPLRDEQGNVIAAMALLQDFTAQKKAEEAFAQSESNYRMLFNTMLNGFALHEIICNEEGQAVDYRFLEVNPAFEHLTGLLAKNILGKTALEVIPDLDPSWIEIYGKVALTGEPVQFENDAAQLQRHYLVYAFRPRENQFATMFTDVTASRQAEDELHAYAGKLKRSNQDLEDFALSTAHDLREPLRKVKVYAELLKSHAKDGLDAQSQDFLERMTSAEQRMQTMLDGLLAYSRINTVSRPFGPVDLRRIAQEVIADLELRVEQSGGKVVLGDLPTLDADPVQVRQLLQNLIGNGLKFHRPGIPPLVRVSAQPAEGGMLCLVVEDNGIGFDPAGAGQLFQPFHRLLGRSEFEGSGMGLAICRKIAERHGGTIRADARPGEGATFTVLLPLKPLGEA
jgi:PAS domain S-box-containing protein